MKRKYVLLMVICLLVTGCGKEKPKVENRTVASQLDKEKEDIINAGANESTNSGIDSVETDNESTDVSDKQIKEQSFDIALDSWGDVTFASFMPEENKNKDGDVQFKLLNGNEEIYHFPGITEDNCRDGQSFEKVEAIAFKDYNKDGKKDIIIINEYAPQSGPNAEDSYKEVRVYTQKEEGKEFIADNCLMEYLNKYFYNDTIDSVMKGITEYQQEMEKEADYYGDYLITECEGVSKAYAMSQEETDAAIGNTLSYHAASYSWNENTMATGYQEEIFSTERLSEDYGIEVSALGIMEKEVLAVTVLTEGDFIGQNFYVLDDNTLLVYYEGVFFKAERISKKQ